MWFKIFQIFVFQFVFLIIYRFWLQKETFFNANRVYLLLTSLISIAIPFIVEILSFSNLNPQNQQLQEVVFTATNIQLPEIVLSTSKNIDQFPFVFWIYIFGVSLTSFLFFNKVSKIYMLISRNNKQKTANYTLVLLPNSTAAFSFMSFIFLGEDIREYKYLLNHEKVHVIQKHSWDLLWFELLKIVFWFNPLIYLYQKSINALHEYIADSISIKSQKTEYFNLLLNGFFKIENMAFVNQFYHQSLIKKRIIMMTKNNSNTWKTIKYTLVVPLVLSMLFVSFQAKAQKDFSDAVSFAKIDEVPVFPGCENIQDNKAQRNCLSKKIQVFVSKEYNIDLAQDLGLTPGKKRIFVRFIIDENGDISAVKARAPHKLLQVEAERVVKSLPKMIPGKHKNKNVAVKYTLPIVFLIEGDPKVYEVDKPKHKKSSISEAIPFAIIDQIPVYPGCENADDQKQCLSEKVQEHVAKNFNKDLMQKIGLSKGIKKIFSIFTIDADGNITDIRARAAHQSLENEAIRVLKMLPQMHPGKQDKQAISVKYSLPIAFKVK
jgi:beta-lactamase regulating signal transducer with metallopeptidase domain